MSTTNNKKFGGRYLLYLLLLVMSRGSGQDPDIFFRFNQLGFLPGEGKTAIVFSDSPLAGLQVELIDTGSGVRYWGPRPLEQHTGSYGDFAYHYGVDFSTLHRTGQYRLRIMETGAESRPFPIGPGVYAGVPETVLEYLRQQRCGYNPFFDRECHRLDGRSMYGPLPDGTYLDVSGGWHDAGDHLRYLLTSGNTVGRLLLTYRDYREKFRDRVDQRGQAGPNGIPDILDEARWGLEWMLKMHPAPDQLFHQVADDRDHIGFKLPYADSADYGWGPGSYRVVYYATGAPQGLGQYQNTSTGIANLAGRYAAAMAMASGIWRHEFNQVEFAERCLTAAREVYRLGQAQPGCQEGTPCRAPYRYYENTWTDDMEWGAAELYRITGESHYLEDAKAYAVRAGSHSWMGRDTARHYELYPFMNMGHYALYDLVDAAFQDTLSSYYRTGLEAVIRKAETFAYGTGHPFIWCSNNLAAAFVNQGLLYEKMSADSSYHTWIQTHRDWLLGRNPWGVSQFVGIPGEGVTPLFPHTAVTLETDMMINGGMNDGPVYASIYSNLKGIRLSRPDPYVAFQSNLVVYHDDLWDYSTNEPTLDGTAEALYFLTAFSPPVK